MTNAPNHEIHIIVPWRKLVMPIEMADTFRRRMGAVTHREHETKSLQDRDKWRVDCGWSRRYKMQEPPSVISITAGPIEHRFSETSSSEVDALLVKYEEALRANDDKTRELIFAYKQELIDEALAHLNFVCASKKTETGTEKIRKKLRNLWKKLAKSWQKAEKS